MLPPFLRGERIIEELIKTEEIELDRIRLNVEDFENQLFIRSATWGLKFYERELGIVVDESKDLEERRSKVISKMRSRSVANEETIKRVAESFKNGDISLEFQAGNILVYFDDLKGQPSNVRLLENSIKELIPCHLGIRFEFIYNTWGDLENESWGDLESKTWGQLLTDIDTYKVIAFGADSNLCYTIETDKPIRFEIFASPDISIRRM